MTSDDSWHGDDGAVPPARMDRPRGHRSLVVAGVTGLAVTLGAAAYFITSAIVGDDTPAAQQVRVIRPATGAARTATPSPSTSVSAASPSAATRSSRANTERRRAAATTAATKDPEKVRQEIMAARRAAEKNGFPVQRPLETRGHVAGGGAMSETTRRLPGGGTMRITTAGYDLSGQRPLVFAADDGTPVGDSRCTRKFRFSQGDPGGERPTMLLCWRTSDKRSVAVLAVTPTGTPSAAASVAVIASEWKKPG
ncbi:hypothetical protein [Actinoplanes siamensis]|uniref:Uncharacterized protein n=1 Tax=Actinoplanes siamensis TaxID=1223317 RepID=A0A919THS2_9ACTN|nr:hypothetical protein [Actinoplanes siamensis]GIF03682.1 hypothetical protein Asi03nite_12200 [Actinoplanes siamensis]